MISLKYSCSFLLHKRKASDKEAHLICRVKWNSSRSIISLNLGYLINPAGWDQSTQMCRLRSTHGPARIPASVINTDINRYRDAADEVFGGFAKRDVWPTVDQARQAMRVVLGLEAPEILSTSTIYARFMKEEAIERCWSSSTTTKMSTTRDHILSFAPFATMDGFSKRNLALYIEHLRTQRGLADTTIDRHLSNVKWFLNWSYDQHYLRTDEYKRFRPKLNVVPPPIVFLTWDELMQLWNFTPKYPEQQETLDFFLFCCFTSLRWSDCHNLKWSQVSEEGIEVVTIKTVDPVVIQFNKWSREIIDKYIDKKYPGDYVFCRTSNQKMNKSLKLIARDAGIEGSYNIVSFKDGKRTEEPKEKWELIKTHCGRRTFICNALMMGIPPSIVMKWTGHSDYDTMRPYIAIADQSLKLEMQRFNR